MTLKFSPQHSSLVNGVRRLIGHLSKRRRGQLVGLLPLMLVGAVAELASLGAVLPFLSLLSDPSAAAGYPVLQRLFSLFGWHNGQSILLPVTVLFAVVTVCSAAIRMFVSWVSFKFTFAVGLDIGVDVYRRTLYQPYSFHVARNTSEIIGGINKVQTVVFNVINPLVQSVVALVVSLVVLGGLIVIDASTALLAGMSFALIYLAVTLSTRHRLRANSKIMASSETKRIQAIQEGLGGIRDVLIDGTQAVYINRFSKVDAAQRRAQGNSMFISSSPRYLIESIGMILIAALAYWLSLREGGLTAAIPTLGALAIGAQKLLPQLQQIYQGWTTSTGNRAAMDDVLELLEQAIPVEYQSVALPGALHLRREIALHDVHFRYGDDTPEVLRGISLRIPCGSRVGFVGKTGSGKSTLIDLIMGLLDATHGSVKIDGQPLSAMNRRAWHARIAHVPQVIYLSDATIAENIAFGLGTDEIDMTRVELAARMAQIADHIEALPDGYKTQVGERGVRLSGGQRQRIGIARALYKRAEVLILDEATSALDEETENLVMANITSVSKQITLIIIAHRTSTLRECDSIYEIKGGVLCNYQMRKPSNIQKIV